MEAQRPGFLASVWANPEGPSQLLNSLQDRLRTSINLHVNYIFPGGSLLPVPPFPPFSMGISKLIQLLPSLKLFQASHCF